VAEVADHRFQMLYFQTKNNNLGKFGGGLEIENVGIFMVIW
jgi:hypothetical protein